MGNEEYKNTFREKICNLVEHEGARRAIFEAIDNVYDLGIKEGLARAAKRDHTQNQTTLTDESPRYLTKDELKSRTRQVKILGEALATDPHLKLIQNEGKTE